MGFKEAIRTCLREKYFTFSGRASRSEYWYYTLFVFLVAVVLALLVGVLGGFRGIDTGNFSTFTIVAGGIAVVGLIYLYIPGIAVSVRRYHDRELSGWVFLAVMVFSNIPYVGILVSIGGFVITVLKGTDGDNKYGHDPLKAQNSADVFA